MSGISQTGMSFSYGYDTATNTTQVTNYTLNGSQITHMTRGNDWMHFYYGATDRPVLVNFNDLYIRL